MNSSDSSCEPHYWRSLEELAGTPEFEERLHREFPSGASEWEDPVGRRNFLRLMAASISLAGLTGCTKQPTEKIVPYVRPPEEVIPGKALYFATAVTTAGLAQGVLVESHEGRPTKIEGNPDHPASLGATDVVSQAAVLSLYDPDRAQSIRGPQAVVTWNAFQLGMRRILAAQREKQGAGLRILTQTVTSPTLAAQLHDVLTALPQARWFQYEPTGAHSARAGSQAAFGQAVNTYYKLDAAKTMVSLDSDFLACGPASTRYTHDFAAGRRARGGNPSLNRLYVIESTMTSTGGKADHRWPVRPSQVEAFAEELAAALGVAGAAASFSSSVPPDHVKAIARDLQAAGGAAVVIPGDTQSVRVHALAHAMNAAIGATGKTVVHTAPVEAQPVDQIAAIRELVGEMNAEKVQVLLIVGGNPVYDAPVDLNFAAALAKVADRVFLSEFENETGVRCNWLLPQAHSLETWSDARAFDGTVTILQPLIAPLYDAHSSHELMSLVLDHPMSAYEAVRSYWSTQKPAGDFEAWWRKSVHDGVVENSALPTVNVTPGNLGQASAAQPQTPEIAFRPDPYLLDGRLANNAWVQELPRPMTKLTWDNAALISPRTASRLGVESHHIVRITHQGRTLEMPAWVVAGQPDETITVHLGYGRTNAGRVGNGAGFNTYLLRTSDALWNTGGAAIEKRGGEYRLASTQGDFSMEGRKLVVSRTADEYSRDPDLVHKAVETPPKTLTLYPVQEYKGYAGQSWGMVIDQTACVNCNACVIACQAENNIPVVGKHEVMRQRYMHWLRVDTYYEGSAANPSAHYQPVPCMQCEYAPCELVCPVQATNHSQDGLNDQVYNRCVGTRYCSNNCPYKVRRFNFFLYSDWVTESTKLQRNPDVTVRSRGVMEKCTYCVQRIREAEIVAREENRPIRDGEVLTACQQVCPAEAIVFGNINDPASKVAALKADKLNYSLLAELNTRPRTTYLAELRNPSPEVRS